MKTEHKEGVGRYYHTPDGEYPSVTTVLGAYGSKTWLKEWRESIGVDIADAIMKEATDIGTHLHALFESLLLKQAPPPSTLPEERIALDMFKASSPKLLGMIESVMMMEEAVWSNEFRIAGRFDCLAMVGGKVTLVDFKTTRSTKSRKDIDSYRQQMAFYSVMIKERLGIEIEQMVIFMVNRQGFVQRFTFLPEETPRSELVAIRKNFWEKYKE